MGGPLAFVDCETTGLDPEQHEVWEVALALYDAERRAFVGQRCWQLPVDLSRADPEALRIGRFHDRRRPDEHLTRLDDFAGEFSWLVKDCPMVGANPAFDAEFLRRIMRAAGGVNPWHYRVVDIEAMMFGFMHGAARGAAAVPRAPWSSTALSQALGVVRDPATMHTAMGDVLWCVDIWETITGGAG